MYSRSAAFYDATYGSAYDFVFAAKRLLSIVQAHVQESTFSLLDVACGTGTLLANLEGKAEREGLDLNPEMLAIARAKLPRVPLHLSDMADFELPRQFDAVTCLGSSIGHALSTAKLEQTIRNLSKHTRAGGIIVVEPWITPDHWEPGRLTMNCVDGPEVKIAQMTLSGLRGDVSTLDVRYLAGTVSGFEQFDEHLELGLFTHDEYLNAFRAAGLDVTHDPAGFFGRGLYIGTRSVV